MSDFLHKISIKPKPEPQKERRKGVVYIPDSLPPLGRRLRSPFWDFYDLGTRLQSVATPSSFLTGIKAIGDLSAVNTDVSRFLEYVEIFFGSAATLDVIPGIGVPLGEQDVYNFSQFHVFADPDDDAAIEAWDDRLLDETDGTNPFQSTRMSHDGARAIPNCMPIKFYGTSANIFFGELRPNDVFDVETYDAETPGQQEIYQNFTGGTERALTLGRSFATNLLENEDWVSPDDFDVDPPVTERRPQEKWNPMSLEQDVGQIVNIEPRGRLDVKGKEGQIQVRVLSPNSFESFDTGDTENYKVTTSPSFASPEIAFQATAATPMKFYLKPRWFAYYRTKAYTYNVLWEYESYRRSYGDGTYWNQWDQPSTTGGHPGSGSADFWSCFVSNIGSSGPSGFVDNPVGTGTVDFTFNRTTGAFSTSGLPGGDVSGSANYTPPSGGFAGSWSGTAQNVWYTANFVFSEDILVGDVVKSDTYEPAWQAFGIPYGTPQDAYYGFGVSQGYSFQIGAHVGRTPAFPRMARISPWEAMFAPMDNPRTYSNGSTKTWELSVASGYPGQSLRVFAWDDEFADVYRRHPERDQEAFLGLRTGPQIMRIPPESGSFPSNTTTAATHGTRTAVDGTDTLVSSHNATILAEVTAELTGAHLRNVVISDNDPVTPSYGDICLAPIDLPVGALCGVIVKGGTKYYIWRKTPETRQTYDYERRQMRFAGNYEDLESE